MFQSLFYWKYHFNYDINENIPKRMRKFQSLFYWKYHFNFLFMSLVVTMPAVSILVLLEVPLQLCTVAAPDNI